MIRSAGLFHAVSPADSTGYTDIANAVLLPCKFIFAPSHTKAVLAAHATSLALQTIALPDNTKSRH